MTYKQGFNPNWASAPGDTIRDVLKEKNLSVAEFAQRLEFTAENAKDLLQGRSTITISVARKLTQVLGASLEFWMSRDYQYREDVAKLNAAEKSWLSELPLGDMIQYGWLETVPHPAKELESCLNYFNVSSIQEWTDKYSSLQGAVAFRTSRSFDSHPAAVAAWLRQGEIAGQAIDCAAWNMKGFQKALLDIRALTVKKDPQIFIPALQLCCAKYGVAVVIVRTPTGCRASGATHFLSKNKALLQLSFRYLSDDHFWFTFFHEAAHLVLHGDKMFIEGAERLKNTQEKEADDFAESSLIPIEFKSELLALPRDGRAVIRFAKRLGISPGIVVGQLQHFKKILPNQLNQLKRRYCWER